MPRYVVHDEQNPYEFMRVGVDDEQNPYELIRVVVDDERSLRYDLGHIHVGSYRFVGACGHRATPS